MKTIGKIISIVSLSLLASAIFFGGCKKKESDEGSMTVRMTDAPAAFSEVNVEITGLEVNHTAQGWVALPVNQGVYNLLELQNNVSVVLADNVKIPAGRINQMRLILGANNSVKDSIAVYPLTIPSGSETGLKLNINQTIEPNKNVEILLDFDANASIVVEGNGGIKLKPVLKVLSVVQN